MTPSRAPVARHLVNHIPGNPGVIVQNTPGGGSLTMTNRIYRVAPQDGTVVGLVQRGVLLAQLTKQPNVQFDITKLHWIGSVSPEISLVVAWNTAPVKTVQDLQTKALIVGGTGATSDLEASARLLNATIGTKFKIVSGYPGQADVSLAMERGEIQGTADWAWSEIKTRHADLLAGKKLTLLLQNALSKAPDLPDVPLAIDFIKDDTDRQVAQLYFGVKEVARSSTVAGPGVPADRIDALRVAFMALKDDADLGRRMQATAGIEVRSDAGPEDRRLRQAGHVGFTRSGAPPDRNPQPEQIRSRSPRARGAGHTAFLAPRAGRGLLGKTENQNSAR